jgi:hypothetical protein
MHVVKSSPQFAPPQMMSEKEEGALWRQRFFEAQAGMERYLIEKYGSQEISRWLPVKAEILKQVDGVNLPDEAVQGWKECFFKTQARLERYVAENHGLEDLDPWTAAIGEVFKYTEPDRGDRANGFALRLARQAYLYRSQCSVEHPTGGHARVVLQHCSIWDYREEARARGVTLSLTSPCTYCTRATVANAKAKGLTASYALQSSEAGHGCTWEIENEN